VVGVSAASVPKILLSLGACCLLIAGVVFLAVSWSVLGVAGRTATLLGFTAIAGGLAVWAAGRGLRAAAEALSIVTLGLLGLDAVGAEDAGWFGPIAPATFAVLLGFMLVGAGGAAALAARRTPVRRLAGAELIAALGTVVIIAGVLDSERLAMSAALVVCVALSAAAAGAGWRLRLILSAVGASAAAVLTWLALLVTSAERALLNPSARELWVELEGWPLLAAAGFAGALGVVGWLPVALRVLGAAVCLLVLGFASLVPFSYAGDDLFTLAVLALLLVLAAATWRAPAPWSWAPGAPMVLSGAWAALVAAVLATEAVERLLEAGSMRWAGGPAERLPALDGQPSPWLLPLCAFAVVLTGLVLARPIRLTDLVPTPTAGRVVGTGMVTAAILTVALYPVAVWLMVALLLLAAGAFVGWALARHDLVSLVWGAVLLLGGTATALVDEWLTGVALVVAAGLSLAVRLRSDRSEAIGTAGAVFAVAVAALVWTVGALAEVQRPWTALVTMLVMAGLALAMPDVPAVRSPVGVDPAAPAAEPRRPVAPVATARRGVDVGVLMATAAAAVTGVAAAPQESALSWVAVYLTVAGGTTSAIALLRADRHNLGWLGGGLLAAATWVRFVDVGVQTPEAYTLPSALALCVVGLAHLRRHPGASTMTALSPGLGLALVPSLIWVLRDPLAVRSVLLGLACLGLIMLGLRMRWAAPFVFGAAVGTVLVLRHGTPYAEAVPRWTLIGMAGALLIGVGVTYERRLQQAKTMVGHLRALR
jgi:hypothetical protein